MDVATSWRSRITHCSKASIGHPYRRNLLQRDCTSPNLLTQSRNPLPPRGNPPLRDQALTAPIHFRKGLRFLPSSSHYLCHPACRCSAPALARTHRTRLHFQCRGKKIQESHPASLDSHGGRRCMRSPKKLSRSWEEAPHMQTSAPRVRFRTLHCTLPLYQHGTAPAPTRFLYRRRGRTPHPCCPHPVRSTRIARP